MAIQLKDKGMKLAGIDVPAFTILTGLAPGVEAALVQGGNATALMQAPGLTPAFFSFDGVTLKLLKPDGTEFVGGGGGGAGAPTDGYLGSVATTAGLVTTFTTATRGATAHVGADANTWRLYQLKSAANTAEADWQSLQDTVPDGTVVTREIIPRMSSGELIVNVPLGSDAVIRVTIGGVLHPMKARAAAQPWRYRFDDSGAGAAATTVALQRVAGAAATTGFYFKGV